MNPWEFFWTHNLQPDYWQFYIILALGFIYLEYRFRWIKKKFVYYPEA